MTDARARAQVAPAILPAIARGFVPGIVSIALGLTACPRHGQTPDVPVSAPTADVTVASDAVPAHDAAAPALPTAAGGVPRDGSAVGTVLPSRATHPALAGPWRRMPVVTLHTARVLATWDEPPDLDGDDIPDAVSTVAWDPRVVGCTATGEDRPCPTLDADDSGGNAGDGPLLVAVVAFLSGDSSPVDGGRPGRLVGLRRLWQAASDMPSTRLSGFEFAEFGPGVLVRATLVTHGLHEDDALDVVDLYTGAGLDRHAGAMVQHCTHEPGHTPTRSGTISVAVGSLAPLLWRAAQAHPFSGCATTADALDASLGSALSRGAVARVTATSPAGTRPHVSIAYVNGTLQLVSPAAGTDNGPPPSAGPLTINDRTVQDMVHGCGADRLRYTEGTRHCTFQVPRDDGPMPGCQDHPSPLDPRPPRPLALLGGEDGGVPRLVFTRGGSLLSTLLPARCGRSTPRADVSPWHDPLPAGLAASSDGQRVLFPSGYDLWLFVPGRRTPILLNPPGGALPRGTVRAVAFADAGRAAAVISEDLVQFDITLTDDDAAAPADVRIDPGEVRRPLRM